MLSIHRLFIVLILCLCLFFEPVFGTVISAPTGANSRDLSQKGLETVRRNVFLQNHYDAFHRHCSDLGSIPAISLYGKGLQDAKAFYKNKAVFWGTYTATAAMVSTFFTYTVFLPGVITGATLSLIKPKENNLKPHLSI